MLRLAIRKTTTRPSFSRCLQASISNWKIPSFQIDAAGISGYLQSRSTPYLTFSQKIAQVRPGSLYHGLDEWTRQLLVTLSTDLNCGFATSIIIATCIIKTIFLYPTLKGQLQGLRQAQIKQLSDIYKERMKTAQMTRNQALMTQASYEYKMGMKKKGINQLVPILNLFQIPVLLTWFFSLRYMSNLPEVFPQMLSEGYLWFTDLSAYDPYFVLPVAAACLTSLSIVRSPNLARNRITLPFMAPYIKYIKYLPFASLTFTAFFPASINLYWATLAGYQLMTTQLMYNGFVRKTFGGYRMEKDTKMKYDSAVLVDEKKTAEEIMVASQQKFDAKIEQMQRKKLQKGKILEVNDIKVSFKKIKKKKKQDDSSE